METDRIRVRGVKLAMDIEGTGPPFVWCHGLTSCRAREDETGLFDWSRLHDVARVVRYDARGHGLSEASLRPEDYGWEALADDLIGLADALGLHRFRAGGASMGAATLLHAVVRAPERFDALVLAVPPTAWETRRAQAAVYLAAAELVERRGVDAFLEAAARRPVPAVLVGFKLVGLRPAIPEAALPTVLRGAAGTDLPGRDALREIRQPTLVLAWDTDPVHPLSTAEELAALIPDSRLEVAYEASRLARWPDLVREFLDEVS